MSADLTFTTAAGSANPITATPLITSGSHTNGSRFSTASITPGGGKLVLAWIVNTKNTTPDIPTLTGNGLTWVRVATVLDTGNTRRLSLFRALGGSPSTGPVTINFAGNPQTSCLWSISQFGGVNTSGTSGSGALVQYATARQNGNGSMTVTLGTFASTANAAAGGISKNTTSAVTPGSGFTQLATASLQATPKTLIASSWKASNDTTVDWTFSSASTEAIAVEIRAATQTTAPLVSSVVAPASLVSEDEDPDQTGQAAEPSAQALFVPLVVENSRFRTNLGINNISESVASVRISLMDREGRILGTKTVEMGPLGLKQINSIARILYEENPDQEIQGSLYFESDQPIRAWASQIDNETNDPSLLQSHRTGSSRILIPSAANLPSFSSSLVLMNVGFNTAQVLIKAYDLNGSVIGQTQTPFSLTPRGMLTFENVLQTLGVTDTYGPVEIVSLNDVPLRAVSRVSGAGRIWRLF